MRESVCPAYGKRPNAYWSERRRKFDPNLPILANLFENRSAKSPELTRPTVFLGVRPEARGPRQESFAWEHRPLTAFRHFCLSGGQTGHLLDILSFRFTHAQPSENSVSILSSDALAKLAKFDTPTVCNAIELFAVRPREADFTDARIRACFPDLPPMVGYASTATFRSLPKPSGGDGYSSLTTQIEQIAETAGPPVVVFQDLDGPAVGATFGEVMCTAYQAFGAVGLITSGAGRDLDQVAALKFPAFTNGTIASHANCHFPSLGGTVTIGGCVIRPGDLLHGDLNGVTILPPDIAGEIAGVCGEVVRAEDIMLSYLKSGSVTPAGFAEARAASQVELDAISKRLQS